MSSNISIPIRLIHESEGHTVTIELKSGEVYRGFLVSAEDNMNVQIKTVTLTARDGKTTALDTAFIRGSKIRYFIIPDMLKNAPMFKILDPNSKTTSKGRGIGFGIGKTRGNAPTSNFIKKL
jgi:small nuclear ribonucleoprotein D3